MEIIIIGTGQFGSALAQRFSKNNHTVFSLNRHDPWPTSLSKKHYALLAVPTQSLPELLAQRATNLRSSPVIISTAKGLLKETQETPLKFISRILKRKNGLSVLSGPSFASEIMQDLPAALVIGAKESALATQISHALTSGTLRIYSNNDPLGVELCGALKNVYAVLAGLCYGIGFGESARASLNTRALAELSRLIKVSGGNPQTTFGLAGAGDLFLTCSSEKSRNFLFGKGLVEAANISSLIESLGTVEGYWTTFAAQKMVTKKRVRAPLVGAAYQILFKNIPYREVFLNLMSRKPRGEFE